MEVALKGLAIGVTVSFLIGPIFLGLVDITLSKGWKSGLAYILAVIISDIVLIMLVDNIFSRMDFDVYKFYIGFVGGMVLMLFGIATFFSKINLKKSRMEDIKTIGGAFIKGVSINILNPFVILWWIGLYTSTSVLGYTPTDKIVYYSCILLVVFLFDLLKMRFAFYLKYKLSIEKIAVVKKAAGIALFIFGIVMLARVAA
jgi:threonine/homoserine/homoserine lactone efflux protein